MRRSIGLGLSFSWIFTLLTAASSLTAQTSFQPSFQSSILSVPCAYQIIVGDFNGDKVPDIAAWCLSQEEVYVLLGNGDGTYKPYVMTSFASADINSDTPSDYLMVAADLNGDGKTDLVYTGYGPHITIKNPDGTGYSGPSSTVVVLLANGDGTFAPPNTVATSLTGFIVGAADLNGDGIPDLVLDGGIQFDGVEVMFGQGDGTFSSSVPLDLPPGYFAPHFDAAADFHRDGKLDILFQEWQPFELNHDTEPFWVLQNQGSGVFSAPALVFTQITRASRTIVLADFNGDGKLDIGVLAPDPSSGRAFRVYFGNGDGTFQTPTNQLGTFDHPLFALDLNGDGKADMVQMTDDGDLIFYLSNGDGTFQTLPAMSILAPFQPTGVADLNGDGKPDILGFASTGLGVLINTTVLASTTGAVNGASFVTGGPLTGGSIASIFGSGFSSANTYASVIPLPTTLDDVSVTIAGFPAPLLFAGAKQINLQVPWGVTGSNADVVVTVNGTPLAPYSVSIAAISPAVFTTQSGIGQAIAINPDGTLAGAEGSIPGTLTHPAKVGDPLVILATGLGPVAPTVADGANSEDTLRNTVSTPTILIGGTAAEVEFSGLSPQFVGLNQINVVVPQVTAGVWPLQISMDGVVSSAQVTIAVENN
jgi:uncharacterized protein (TIGR03437 family)